MPRASWKPRCSSLGYYWLCDYRAAFDRALAEGLIELPANVVQEVEARKASSPYADLGTLIHHHLQVGIEAVFPKGAGEAPGPEVWTNASALFSHNLDRTAEAVRASAVVAAPHLPALPEGVYWLAEAVVRTRHYTGHIDLVSSDGEWLIDLKTTSRQPANNRAKLEHKIQVHAYRGGLAVKPRRGRILYVDSLAAAWALPIDIDFTTEEEQHFGTMAAEYAAYLRSRHLFKVAVPRIGHVCEEWCPYTSICRDLYRPGQGEVARPVRPTVKAPL